VCLLVYILKLLLPACACGSRFVFCVEKIKKKGESRHREDETLLSSRVFTIYTYIIITHIYDIIDTRRCHDAYDEEFFKAVDTFVAT
jgi:hypothetical protein